MASTSLSKVSLKDPASNYNAYPSPLACYEDVVASQKLFMDTLEKLHSNMGTKFMIPIIGGKELDLHRLFVEVTTRGGLSKIIRERKWKEVTAIFNFPSTATNASFVLRKYYLSLLYHYEQIYYFKASGWTPTSYDFLRNSPVTHQPMQSSVRPSIEIDTEQPRLNIAEMPTGSASTTGAPVVGVIDGKFESGYLVTVTIGSEKLKGVLYQAPQGVASESLQHYTEFASKSDKANVSSSVHPRRRRRKKSEIKRRDPDHPKPNRSGYNFFFAEQHARLKPLHPGKDREISRMIGELWTNLNESDKKVYQEKAQQDKERYRIEMESYREKLKSDQVISDAVPLQERHPKLDEDIKPEVSEGVESVSDSSSAGGDFEDDKTGEKDLDVDVEESPVEKDFAEPMNVDATEPVLEPPKVEGNVGNNKVEKFVTVGEEKNLGNAISETERSNAK